MRTTAPNAEINRELAIISKAYTLGIQGKLVSFRPHIPKLKENNRRKGFFEREQFVTVRSYLPQPIQALTTCGYITGWRIKSEVQPLTWPQVNLGEGGVIRLEGDGTKNEEPREFPIAGEPRTVLETQAAKADALFLERGVFVEHAFFWEDGSPIKDFRGSWETGLYTGGARGKGEGWGGRQRECDL